MSTTAAGVDRYPIGSISEVAVVKATSHQKRLRHGVRPSSYLIRRAAGKRDQ